LQRLGTRQSAGADLDPAGSRHYRLDLDTDDQANDHNHRNDNDHHDYDGSASLNDAAHPTGADTSRHSCRNGSGLDRTTSAHRVDAADARSRRGESYEDVPWQQRAVPRVPVTAAVNPSARPPLRGWRRGR
jgi:hypothetical protein